MKAFASWSGGKDCMFASYKFLENKENEIVYLVNMCGDDGEHSRSHGIKKDLIEVQASQMGLNIIQQSTNFEGYEKKFKEVITQVKKEGVTTGVFGDIYLQAHKDWIDRVCDEMNITPIFPLWQKDTKDLLQDFISIGFKTITVAIDNTKLPEQWVGRVIDNNFLEEITNLKGIDPCAENGEYHSFVFDGPLFNKSLAFEKGRIRIDGKNTFQEIILKPESDISQSPQKA